MLDLAVSALFAFFGAVVVGWSLLDLWEWFASRNWSTTEGVVLSSLVDRTWFVRLGRGYWPQVSYAYTVNDQKFVGSRARFGDWIGLGWSGPAERIVVGHPSEHFQSWVLTECLRAFSLSRAKPEIVNSVLCGCRR
jgi:hypothetical protein